jgi:hypothetical protein
MPSYEWTQVAFWKHPHLSYILFIVITVLGGLLGLDHLYLRSPMTAGLKLASNLVLPGFWWLYDILQATTEKDIFLKFGLNTPIIPSSGIGAGMFAPGFLNPGPEGAEETEVPAGEKPPSPFWFIAYAFLALMPIGLDHFVVGDSSAGMLKLWLTMMLLFPLGFAVLPLLLTPLTWGFSWIWTFYNWFRIMFRTDKLFTQGVTRFGVPGMEPYFMAYGRLSSLSMNPEGSEEPGFFQKLKDFIGFIFFGWIAKIPFIGEIIMSQLTSILTTLKNLPIVGEVFALLLKIKDAAIAAKDAAIIVAKSTVIPAMKVAGEVGHIVTEAPAAGAEAMGIIKDGIGQKLKALPPPQAVMAAKMGAATGLSGMAAKAIQSGGGITSSDDGYSLATLGLIGIVSTVAIISITKYLFNRYHSDKITSMERAVNEQPPSRSDFSKEKEAKKGDGEVPPEPEAKNVKAANE